MFHRIEKDGVVFYRSDILTAPHGFSTIIGGASTLPETQSMNFGSGVSDPMVSTNIDIFTRAASLPPKTVRVKQIHSTEIYSFTKETDLDNITPDGFYVKEGDGFFSYLGNLTLTVRTADCLPILLSSKDGKTVAALHAGWRGSVNGIASEAVKKFISAGVKPEDVQAALGPCISECCFKVGEDFLVQFKESISGKYADEVISKRNGNYYCDLKKLNRLILESAGVLAENIDICPLCTHHTEGIFFSHRKTGFARGTMGSCISPVL